ncbi:MAG: hypothetical protein LDL41_05780 [Coleofasciculus sp. S288]|nr:hypothetical protein [Coleofasciculus sp. S288]
MIDPELAAEISQEHEGFLNELEGLAIEAIASNNWTPVLQHLNEIMAWQDANLHEAQKSKASADELETPSAGLAPTTTRD